MAGHVITNTGELDNVNGGAPFYVFKGANDDIIITNNSEATIVVSVLSGPTTVAAGPYTIEKKDFLIVNGLPAVTQANRQTDGYHLTGGTKHRTAAHTGGTVFITNSEFDFQIANNNVPTDNTEGERHQNVIDES